jgi:hypothetical protein
MSDMGTDSRISEEKRGNRYVRFSYKFQSIQDIRCEIDQIEMLDTFLSFPTSSSFLLSPMRVIGKNGKRRGPRPCVESVFLMGSGLSPVSGFAI